MYIIDIDKQFFFTYELVAKLKRHCVHLFHKGSQSSLIFKFYNSSKQCYGQHNYTIRRQKVNDINIRALSNMKHFQKLDQSNQRILLEVRSDQSNSTPEEGSICHHDQISRNFSRSHDQIIKLNMSSSTTVDTASLSCDNIQAERKKGKEGGRERRYTNLKLTAIESSISLAESSSLSA